MGPGFSRAYTIDSAFVSTGREKSPSHRNLSPLVASFHAGNSSKSAGCLLVSVLPRGRRERL
jgi:hypothetical protein